MEDLEVAWKHLKISEEENSAVLINQTNPWANALLPLCLAGKLLTSEKFNSAAMKSTLTSAWNHENEVDVRESGDNLFMFQFFNEEDRDHVLEKGPWCFDDQLLLLSEVSGDASPSSITFPTAMFWVHVKDVPLGLRNDTTIKALSEKLGGYIQHDSDDPLLMGESIRIRARINVSKPLLRSLAVQVQYECAEWPSSTNVYRAKINVSKPLN